MTVAMAMASDNTVALRCVGELGELDDAELVAAVSAAHRQAARAQARELEAIAELRRRRLAAEADGDPDYRVLTAHESVVEEVAVALAVTGNAAATLVHVAERLATDLPATGDALAAGRIDLAKARVICDLSDDLPDGIAERAEAAVLDKAAEQTTGQLRRRLKRIIGRLAPDAARQRTRDTVRGRRLEIWETGTGVGNLSLMDLPAEDAHAIFNKISAAARGLKGDGDDRPLDMIRADLAKELLNGAVLPDAVRAVLVQAQAEPGEQRDIVPAAAPVEAEVETLAETIDERLHRVRHDARLGRRVNELPRLIGRAVRQIQDDVAVQRDGRCQGNEPQHGHPSYRPPAELRREIEARHATCVFPTCNQPSRRCDLDHTRPWRPGSPGITCRCNLAPVCRRHHRTKQSPGWRLHQIWPGLLVWTTPSGAWHIVRPERQ